MVFEVICKVSARVIAEVVAPDFKSGLLTAQEAYPGMVSGLRLCNRDFPSKRIPIQAGLFDES